MSSHRAQRLATAASTAALALFTLYRFRGALLTFFVLDDFWVLRDAYRVQIHSLLDVPQLFAFGRQGFRLYRPLTTTAYSYLLQSLFGFDATGHHAFQLLVFTLNVLLVVGIVRRVSGSAIAGVAAGLVYVLAPGQAVNAYWLSAFTVAGAAMWILLMLWCWIVLQGRVRIVVCTLLQLCGLLASEHAIAAPVLCAIVAWLRHEPWPRTTRTVAAPAIMVAVYCVAKLLYLRTVPVLSPAYTVNVRPAAMLEEIGRYLTACFNVLVLGNFSNATYFTMGCGLLIVLTVAAWMSLRRGGGARTLAAGLAMFIVSLVPVLVLQGHHYDHYICTAALGMVIAVVGMCQLLTLQWRWAVAGFGGALLVIDLLTGEVAWRSKNVFNLAVAGSIASAGWVDGALDARREHPDPIEFLVPIDNVANYVFHIGEAHTYFPGMPPRITRFRYTDGFQPAPSQVVVQPRKRVRFGDPLPFWNPRWDWLRRWAGGKPASLRNPPNRAPLSAPDGGT